MVIVPTTKGKDIQLISRYLGLLLLAVLLVKSFIIFYGI